MLENYNMMKQHSLLPRIAGRYEQVGANTYGFVLGGRYRIATREPENLKAILSTHFKSFMLAPRRTAILKQFLGESIFASNGPEWQHSRAFIRPHLTKDSFIDSEMSRFEKHVSRLVSKIPRDGSKVDLQPLFFAFTMDAVIEMLTGKDLQSEEQLALSKDDNIVELFDDAQKFLAFRIIMPFGGLSAKEKANIKRCHNWVDRCVRQAILEHKSGKVNTSKPCFLQELVKESDDVVRLRSEMIALLIAGRDTTASTLSSLWFVLAKRPDIVAKLKAEVDELGGERPGFAQLKQLTYVQHTIQECRATIHIPPSRCLNADHKNKVLRLYPAVPGSAFEAIEDTFLPLGGGADGKSPVFVPKGQVISSSVFAVHRRKDIYGPDAEMFRPERWEDKSLRPG
jgi:cytochrome P450